MFIINGNQTEFTQWEQGKSLTNPNMKAGDAVQFFSGAGDGSIMTAKEEGGVVLVEVPNIMLKHASNITARFVGGGDYTSFSVIGRKKPKDYVFIDNEYKEKEPTGGGGGNSELYKQIIEGTAVEIVDENLQSLVGCNFEDSMLEKIDLPNVKNIGTGFRECVYLKFVNLPNITKIGRNDFYFCAYLEEINIPNVESIANNAFQDCASALENIVLPKATKVMEGAFYRCAKLKQVDFYKAPTLAKDVFYDCKALTRLICRDESNIAQMDPDAFNEGVALNVSMVKVATGQPLTSTDGYIYVPRAMISTYNAVYTQALGIPDLTPLFRPLEDYTVDGTTMGELDESKI